MLVLKFQCTTFNFKISKVQSCYLESLIFKEKESTKTKETYSYHKSSVLWSELAILNLLK